MLCCVEEELRGKRWVAGRRKGDSGRKGDPGIHMYITKGKLLALTSSQLGLQPPALLQSPSTKDRHTHNPICYTSTFKGEKEVK